VETYIKALKELAKRANLKDPEAYNNSFFNIKKRLAEKMKDPSITTIRLHDLRHYHMTKLARKLQNAEIVRQKVGHKRLNTTQKYMHLTDNNGEGIVESTTYKIY